MAAVEIAPFLDGETVEATVESQTKTALSSLQHFGGVIHSFDDEHFAFIFPKLIPIEREDYPNFLQVTMIDFYVFEENSKT